MGLDELLQSQGYEFDDEWSELEAPAEVWVNTKAGLGIRLLWFRLRR